jgi:hypothetical protein
MVQGTGMWRASVFGSCNIGVGNLPLGLEFSKLCNQSIMTY